MMEIEVETEEAKEKVDNKKPSGAQRRKDTRERIFKDGVWRLPRADQGARVQRGKPRC